MSKLNLKSISPLIAVILLVLVAVVIIGVILAWGKGFTNDSLGGTDVDTYKRSTELSGIIKSKQVIGNNVFLENISSNKNIEIIGYKINTFSLTHDLLNTFVPLDENITLNYSSTQKLELPLPSDKKVMVDLYTSNNEIISVEFNNIQAKNVFAKIFVGSSTESGESVQQTTDGGYIFIGYKNSDVYLVKTDSVGVLDWNYTFGGSSNESGESVQQTTDGGYIVIGYTASYGAGAYDFYLVKTDSSGVMDWNKTFGGSSSEYGDSVQQTSDGGYIVAGCTLSYGTGGYDFYLVKTDSSGVMDWNKTFGGSGNEYGKSVQQTSDGGYVIAGSTGSYGAGGSDVYLVKTDSSGVMDWNYTFGGSNGDYGYSVQQTTDGGYVVAGITNSYGLVEGSTALFVFKTDSQGNIFNKLDDLPVLP